MRGTGLASICIVASPKPVSLINLTILCVKINIMFNYLVRLILNTMQTEACEMDDGLSVIGDLQDIAGMLEDHQSELIRKIGSIIDTLQNNPVFRERK